MDRPTRRRSAVLALVAVVTVAAGACSSPAPTAPASPLGPRPVEIDTTAVRPCEILDDGQRAELDLDGGTAKDLPVGGEIAPTCTYLGEEQHFDYNVQFLPVTAADFAGKPDRTVSRIRDFGAVQIPPASETSPSCEIVVDIADATSLRVQAAATPRTLRLAELPDAALCDKAVAVAEAVLSGLPQPL